jgi:hypothetical protein
VATPGKATTKDTPARDDKALELRVRGSSFVAIAKILGYERANQANEAFNRALRRKPAAEQVELRGQELSRLDAMADGVKANRGLEPKDVDRRLRTVERLRAMLLAD